MVNIQALELLKNSPQPYSQFDKLFLDENSERSVEFKALRTNVDRVHFALNLITDEYGLIEDPNVKVRKKNSDLSYLAWKKGEQLCKEKKFIEALESFNEALCYAIHVPFAKDSKCSLALAYAGRAEVYYNLGYYELCLENLELAINDNHPFVIHYKLLEVKNRCKELSRGNGRIDIDRVVDPKLRLSLNAHPKIPCVISPVEVKSYNNMGRGVRSNKQLNIGDVVLIEEPFMQITDIGGIYSHCANCGANKLFNLIPCRVSTTVMFCSTKCYKEADQSRYNYKNGLTDKFFAILNDFARMAVRLTLKAFSVFKSFTELEELCEFSTVKRVKLIEDYYSDRGGACAQLKCIFALASNSEKISTVDRFRQSIVCGVAFYLLTKDSDLKKRLIDKKHEDLFMKIFLHFYQVALVNMYTVEGFLRSKEFKGEDEPKYLARKYGSGIFALSSMFNHSCTPNIVRRSIGGKNVFVAIQQIDIREQLFIDYGITFPQIPNVRKRQEVLHKLYNFNCECAACVNKWPIVTENTTDAGLSSFVEKGRKLQNRIYDEDAKKLASNTFSHVYMFLRRHTWVNRTKQMLCLREIFLSYLDILYYPKPLELLRVIPGNEINWLG